MWQGPPHINKVKQWKCVVLKRQFVYSVYSVMKTKRVCLFLFILFLKINEDLALVIKMSSPKLHSATFTNIWCNVALC